MGIDAELPPDELEPGDGIEALDPEPPPLDDDGMFELRPPEPPADPPEEPEEPPEDPGGEEEGELGEGIDVDWLAQPPINIAETALTPAIYAAPTSSLLYGSRVFIVAPSLPIQPGSCAAGAAENLRLHS